MIGLETVSSAKVQLAVVANDLDDLLVVGVALVERAFVEPGLVLSWRRFLVVKLAIDDGRTLVAVQGGVLFAEEQRALVALDGQKVQAIAVVVGAVLADMPKVSWIAFHLFALCAHSLIRLIRALLLFMFQNVEFLMKRSNCKHMQVTQRSMRV